MTKKISELTPAAIAALANEYEINEAGTSKKVTGTQMNTLFGGGGLTFARVVKPDDESVTNNIVVQDDDDITIPLSANKTYGYMCIISFDADGTGGLRIIMSVPTNAKMEYVGIVRADSPTTTLDATIERTYGGGGAGVVRSIDLFGRIVVEGNAGNVLLRWAQSSSSATPSIVLGGTYMVIWEEI